MRSVCRDGSAGLATRYDLDGSMIESRWRWFSATVQTGPAPHPTYYVMGTGTSPGVERPGRGVDHPPLFGAVAKERVELYLYPSSVP
jgi:hypothetical protein